MSGEIVFYEFSRPKVECGDFRHFIGGYGPDQLPVGPRLQEMMNTVVFGIAGWDTDPRELHSIPEVRRFYAALHRAWPYALYFCNLDTDAFRMMTLCCLPSIAALKVEGRPTVAVEYDRLELLRFLNLGFLPMNEMCERAGMTERQIFDRTLDLFGYFDLPFESDPPSDD